MTFIRCLDPQSRYYHRGSYPILTCLKCSRFPCRFLSNEELEELYASDRVEKIVSLKKENRPMYYKFEYEDGHIVDREFEEVDIKSINPQWVEGLKRVSLIKTSYVPQISVKLVEEGHESKKEEAPKKRTRKKSV